MENKITAKEMRELSDCVSIKTAYDYRKEAMNDGTLEQIVSDVHSDIKLAASRGCIKDCFYIDVNDTIQTRKRRSIKDDILEVLKDEGFKVKVSYSMLGDMYLDIRW